MRKLFISTISIILMTVCCDKYCQINSLYELNDMVDANPDSVLVVLKGLERQLTEQETPEETKSYYNLLLVKVYDKKHQLADTFKSDSLMNAVVAYYEQHPQSGHLAESYYYAGRMSAELRNGEKALLYYHKALVKDSSHVSNHLRSRIYAQMGIIYLRNELFTEASQMGQLAYFYCQQDSDTLGMRICAETLDDINSMAHESDSAASQNRKQLAALKVLRMNEQLKSDLLNNKNAELQAENNKRKTITWAIIICVLILAAITTLFIRRQMMEKKKLYEEMGTVNAVMRQLYNKDVDKLLNERDRNGEMLKAKDWLMIEETFEKELQKMREGLYAHCNFSEQEFRTCILIKMGISPSMMSTLLATSKSNITQSRQRMQQKVFNGRGSAKDWDKYILSL